MCLLVKLFGILLFGGFWIQGLGARVWFWGFSLCGLRFRNKSLVSRAWWP